tara:strand:- start:443 stop:733 length:291 start_codon:yes stop_codon:yes gene_type:complete
MNQSETENKIAITIARAIARVPNVSLISDISLHINGGPVEAEFRLTDCDDRDRDITWRAEQRITESLSKEFGSKVSFSAGDKGYCSAYIPLIKKEE